MNYDSTRLQKYTATTEHIKGYQENEWRQKVLGTHKGRQVAVYEREESKMLCMLHSQQQIINQVKAIVNQLNSTWNGIIHVFTECLYQRVPKDRNAPSLRHMW